MTQVDNRFDVEQSNVYAFEENNFDNKASVNRNARLREVAIVLFDHFNLSELSIVIDALERTNRIAGQCVYRWSTCTPSDRIVTSGAGLQINANATLDECRADIIIVIGAETLLENSLRISSTMRQLMFGCQDLYLLSESAVGACLNGFLNSGSVAIPRMYEALVQERFLDIELARNLFERNGRITTCIGGIASFDMIICMIIEHHGETLGRQVASAFMANRVRDGGEQAPSLLTDRFRTRPRALNRAIQAMESNLENPLSLKEIAARAFLSTRQLQRAFKVHFAKGPRMFYVEMRLQRAYELLGNTDISVTEASVACGFASASHFSQAFKRHFGFSPSDMLKQAIIPVRLTGLEAQD